MGDFKENAETIDLVRWAIELIREGMDSQQVAENTGLMVCEVEVVRISPFKSALVSDPNDLTQFDESQDHRLTSPDAPSKPLTATIVPSVQT